MQIIMLIRQLDGFDPHKIRKLRANSNSNSKLELDVVGNSVPALHQIHGNPLAYQCGAFDVIFILEPQFNYKFT